MFTARSTKKLLKILWLTWNFWSHMELSAERKNSLLTVTSLLTYRLNEWFHNFSRITYTPVCLLSTNTCFHRTPSILFCTICFNCWLFQIAFLYGIILLYYNWNWSSVSISQQIQLQTISHNIWNYDVQFYSVETVRKYICLWHN